MTIEDALASVLEAKLAPMRAEVVRLTGEIEALRRSLPAQLVTIAEAATLLGLSVYTVRRRLRDGSLPAKRLGRSVRVDLSAMNRAPESEILRMAQVARRVE